MDGQNNRRIQQQQQRKKRKKNRYEKYTKRGDTQVSTATDINKDKPNNHESMISISVEEHQFPIIRCNCWPRVSRASTILHRRPVASSLRGLWFHRAPVSVWGGWRGGAGASLAASRILHPFSIKNRCRSPITRPVGYPQFQYARTHATRLYIRFDSCVYCHQLSTRSSLSPRVRCLFVSASIDLPPCCVCVCVLALPVHSPESSTLAINYGWRTYSRTRRLHSIILFLLPPFLFNKPNESARNVMSEREAM